MGRTGVPRQSHDRHDQRYRSNRQYQSVLGHDRTVPRDEVSDWGWHQWGLWIHHLSETSWQLCRNYTCQMYQAPARAASSPHGSRLYAVSGPQRSVASTRAWTDAHWTK